MLRLCRRRGRGYRKKLTLLALWGYVEADFLREYGVRLAETLPRMGWHEFSALLAGLSPDSALARNWKPLPQSGKQAAATFWEMLSEGAGPHQYTPH